MTAVAFASGSLWIADLDAKSVERVNPASGQLIGKLAVGGVPIGLAGGYGALWQATVAGASCGSRPAELKRQAAAQAICRRGR